MKKKLLFGIEVGALFSATAVQAAGNHTMAGCGFGYMLFGKDGNSKGTQFIAATTNGVLGS